MSTRLRATLLRLLPLLVLWLSPDPREPFARRFKAKQFHEGKTDHVVWVAFFRDTSPLPNKFNSMCIIEMANTWVQIGASLNDSLVYPCIPPDDYIDPGVYLDRADYVVEVPCSFQAPRDKRAAIMGPISCTVVAKRVIGMHDPNIVTAAELLDALWRNQWQS